MTQQEVEQAVLADLQRIGAKSPKLITLGSGDYFPGVITGMSVVNGQPIIDAIDINTHQAKQVFLSHITGIEDV